MYATTRKQDSASPTTQYPSALGQSSPNSGLGALAARLNHSTTRQPVQRMIAIDHSPLPETTQVEAEWGLTPREARIFQIWLKDKATRDFPTTEKMIEAIRHILPSQDLMTPESQPFGTDIARAHSSQEQQIQIFTTALEAGYRTFDCAATYDTLQALTQAVKTVGLSMNQVTVIYKIKPNNDAETDTEIEKKSSELTSLYKENAGLEEIVERYCEHPQDHQDDLKDPKVVRAIAARKLRNDATRSKNAALLETAKQEAHGMPGVLMLHETHADMAVTKNALSILIGYVKAGEARAVGVSNVDDAMLDELYTFSVEQDCPIACVENQFSPYLHDDLVRAYCQENGITYISYGLMGSAQVGACAGVGDDGEGLPTRFLLARHDPRLIALAHEVHLSEGELLVAWARSHGVQPIMFSSNAERAEKNLRTTEKTVTPLILQTLDKMFITPSEPARQALAQKSEKLQALYLAYQDPTAWHILDTLTTAEGVAPLLERVVGLTKPDQLYNLVLKLIRHVADIQSTIQRSKEIGIADWTENIVPAFKAIAEASGNEIVFKKFLDWATTDALLGHTSADAMSVLTTIATSTEDMVDADPHQPLNEAPQAGQMTELSYTEIPSDAGYEGLLTENYAFITTEEVLQTLQPDTSVFWKQKPMTVVANNPGTKTLTLKPSE